MAKGDTTKIATTALKNPKPVSKMHGVKHGSSKTALVAGRKMRGKL